MKEGKTKLFNGIAFVSFNTEKEKNEVLKIHSISTYERILLVLGIKIKIDPSRHLMFYNQPLILEEAPEPSDVSF